MSYSKDKDHNLEGDITFKQSWKLAHNFARQCKDLFPQFEHKALANLFNGLFTTITKELEKSLPNKRQVR